MVPIYTQSQKTYSFFFFFKKPAAFQPSKVCGSEDGGSGIWREKSVGGKEHPVCTLKYGVLFFLQNEKYNAKRESIWGCMWISFMWDKLDFSLFSHCKGEICSNLNPFCLLFHPHHPCFRQAICAQILCFKRTHTHTILKLYNCYKKKWWICLVISTSHCTASYCCHNYDLDHDFDKKIVHMIVC